MTAGPSPDTEWSAAHDAEAPADGQTYDGQTYIDLLLDRLANSSGKIVLRCRGRDLSAREFLESIYRYARALAGLGIDRGSLVALVAPNCPDALAIRYASNLLGAGAVFLSVPGSSRRRAELVAGVAPNLLIVFTETTGVLPSGSVHIPVAAVGPNVAESSLRLDVLAGGQSSDPLPIQARATDLAVIISSGGTTGVPKASRRNFAAYTPMVRVASPPDRRQLINGRLAYLSQVLVDITLLGGGSVVLERSFEPAATLASIESERVTDLFLVEPQLFELMDHPDVGRRDLASLRVLTHIGASAPPTLRRRARERLGPVIAHTYGASEMGIVSALMPAEHDLTRFEQFTSAGRIVPGVEVRLRLADDDFAAVDQAGSIEVSSPAMANGYRNRPELEAAHFRDGWYASADLGRIDADGYLHILGRATDVTWIDGVMVSPTLVEDTLCQLPSVRYAVVVLDEDSGRWIAAVVAWPGASIDALACREAVEASFGPRAATPLVVVPLERVPLTEQGKPDHEAIRALQ